MSHDEEKASRWQISTRDILLFVTAICVAFVVLGIAVRLRADAYPTAIFNKMFLIDGACIMLGACVGGMIGRGIRPELWRSGASTGAVVGWMIALPVEWFFLH
jgi:hypothetical protein